MDRKYLTNRPLVYIDGPVIKGFGRGLKVLRIPTSFEFSLVRQIHDILMRGTSFRSLFRLGWIKMVMSIGWDPYFKNSEKTIEPWLLHDFNEDFYGEDLRLTIVGYIRPEANFSSLESLVAKIHEDREVTEKALELPMQKYKDDPYLKSS